MDTEAKEDKLNQDLEHADRCKGWKIQNPKINRILNEAVKEKRPILLMTDMHLYVKDGNGGTHPSSHHDENLKQLSELPEDAVFIYLGDLTDGEFTDGNKLIEEMKCLKCKNKIMVQGNNDTMPISTYKKIFDIVTPYFIWDNIVFSHFPQRHNYRLNIHGHIHGSKHYWVPYNKHVDIAYLDGRGKPVTLDQAINAYPQYKKKIVEDPRHFSECAELFEYNLLEYVF